MRIEPTLPRKQIDIDAPGLRDFGNHGMVLAESFAEDAASGRWQRSDLSEASINSMLSLGMAARALTDAFSLLRELPEGAAREGLMDAIEEAWGCICIGWLDAAWVERLAGGAGGLRNGG